MLLVDDIADPALADALEAFYAEPSRTTYLAARRVVIASYRRQVADPLALARWPIDEGPDATLAACERLLPAWCLCPRLFRTAQDAAAAVGNGEDEMLYAFVAEACLDGILATGNGTMLRPYVVTYLTDERDVLAALGLQPAHQRVAQFDERVFDLVECSDGRQVWFDVTGVLRAPLSAQTAAHA